MLRALARAPARPGGPSPLAGGGPRSSPFLRPPGQHRSPAPRAAAREPFGGGGGGDSNPATIYDGAYGPWSVEPRDVREVVAYRAGLVGAAAAFGAATLSAQPGAAPTLAAWAAAHPDLSNAGVAAGAAGLGASLALLHLYVAPLKKVLLGLWGAGAVGGAALALAHPGMPLPLVIASTPPAVWAVGPLAAALTGVAIKEGLCYGKLECALLAAALPLAALSHLAGAPPAVSAAATDAAALLALTWTLRKATMQPLVDDIGDKSVFAFRAASAEEQATWMARLKATAAGVGEDA